MTEELNNEQNNSEVEKTDVTENQTENNNNQEENDIELSEPTTFDYDLIKDDESSEDSEDNDSKKPNKAVEALNSMKLDNAISSELSKYFTDNPEAKEYQSHVEKFVKHEQRLKFIKSGLPVSAVIAEALAPYMQKIGAIKAKRADEEANRTRDTNNNSRPSNAGEIDFSKMSNTEIKKLAQRVVNGQYKG